VNRVDFSDSLRLVGIAFKISSNFVQ